MSYRFMRMIIFFDLPTITYHDRREYRKFRKFLVSEGFIMMQESVYCKILLNSTAINTMKIRLRKHKPKAGLVQALIITEKQYASIDYIVGKDDSNIRNDDKRLVIL